MGVSLLAQPAMSPPLVKAPLSLRSAMLFLALAAVLSGGFSAAIGLYAIGGHSVLAVAASVSLCWGAALLALVVAFVAQRANQAVSGVLGGMLVHMFIPLAGMVGLTMSYPPLVQSGFKFFVLGNFLASLAIEAYLATRLVEFPAVAAKEANRHG